MESWIVRIALQQRFQKAEFVIWIALHQQDADLVVADGDHAPLAVVFSIGFVVARRDFDDVRDVARFGRPVDEPHGERLAGRRQA